jgi:trans-2-enoyl-CoA reductase
LTVREWTAARIVLIGGFIIAIAVAGYFTWTQHKQAQEAAAAQQAQVQAAEQAAAGPTKAQIAQAQARMGLAVCLRVAINAAANGIIPNYAKLASRSPTPTKVQGRYTCLAVTDVAKYKVTGDLMCADMRKADCVKLYSVVSDDGTVLYQAPN